MAIFGFVQSNLHRACQDQFETVSLGKPPSIQLAPNDHLDFNLDEIKQFAEAVRVLLQLREVLPIYRHSVGYSPNLKYESDLIVQELLPAV